MKFLRIRIEHFGPLHGVDSGPEPLPGLTVVHGPNEAGKSSFFLALRALLHGIYPANRDGNPWSPWSGETLEIEGEIETRAGEELRVHRRLLATPWGRLHRNGEAENLANRSVPDLGDLSRDLYEHVFTITLPQLAQLQDGDAWKTVRDRLVSGMGTGELAAPREVADALEREAGALWRPNRMGSPRDREIADKIRLLSRRLTEARERDRELRDVVARMETNREALREIGDRLDTLRSFRDGAQRVLPLVPRLATARARRKEAGPPEVLDALSAGLPDRLRELQEGVTHGESRVRAAEEAHVEAGRAVPPEDPLLEAIAERQEPLRQLVSAQPVVQERAGRRERLGESLQKLRGAVMRATSRLFDGMEHREVDEVADSLLPLLDGLPTGELRRRIRLRDEAATRRLGAEEALHAHPGPGEFTSEDGTGGIRGLAIVGGVLFTLGLLLLLVGAGPEAVALLLAGAGLVALLVGGLQWRDRLRDQRARKAEAQRRAEEHRSRSERGDALRAAEEEASREVLSLLDSLPLRHDRRAAPDESLVVELEALREDLARWTRTREELAGLSSGDAGVEAEIDAFRKTLPSAVSPQLDLPVDLERALPHLEQLLGRALEHAHAVREARISLERAGEAVEREGANLQQAQEALRHFGDRVRDALPDPGASGGGEERGALALEAAAAEVERRKEALADARRIEREIEEEAGPLAELHETIREVQGDPDFGEHSLDSLAELQDAWSEEASTLREAQVGLRSRKEALMGEETADEVESAIEALRREQKEVRRERDRLHLLARVVRAAEQEFREAHQPTLIRHAERYLERITGGRYTGLLLGDRDDPDRLQLRAPHLPGPTAVAEPISTGTREQVYLALRLAILELLEGEGEPLPLILDEVLVNWDPQRRSRALDLFEEVARKRQVFLFTCHAELAREAGARGGRILSLSAPDGEEACR